jgi:predicted RNA-binding protein Jag
MYYIAKVKCRTENDNGKIQKVTEQYLVKAVSVTDVEAYVTEKYAGSTIDWELTSVAETKILEVIGDAA